MDIKKVNKKADGTITFKGSLTSEEHEFVLAVGINTLIENGAIKMQEEAYSEEDEELEDILSKVGSSNEELH